MNESIIDTIPISSELSIQLIEEILTDDSIVYNVALIILHDTAELEHKTVTLINSSCCDRREANRVIGNLQKTLEYFVIE